MIKIKNLTATSLDEPLLDDVNLSISPGEVHLVTGPKFSGKSALAHIITGHPGITIKKGGVYWGRQKLNNMPTEDRIAKGIYISFQNPPDFDNLTNWELFQNLFSIKNTDLGDARNQYNEYCDLLDLAPSHGDTFIIPELTVSSQTKKNELLFMLASDPSFLIFDEIDEGLSDDEIIAFGEIIEAYLEDRKKSCLIISRNQLLMEVIKPTHVHVMSDGKIRLSGGSEVFKRIIDDGCTEFS
jgi:Fe-S cluster assembly ATP-binding protein